MPTPGDHLPSADLERLAAALAALLAAWWRARHVGDGGAAVVETAAEVRDGSARSSAR